MLDDLVWTPALRFLVALLLGVLIGLEREHSRVHRHGRAGIRTYALISLFGFGAAWMYQQGVTWTPAAALLALALLVTAEYVAKQAEGQTGWTSEVAALLTFLIGALALLADIWMSMAMGVVATLLLAEKAELETYVERLEQAEFLAVIKFLLVTVIILPVLPNTSFTRFELNPRHIWQIVVLVSSIGFVGYFLSKRLGSRIGLPVSGILGGIVSSTAVCIAVGRMAQQKPELRGEALQATLLASSVMYLRILVLIWILNAPLAMALWWKLMLLTAVGVGLSWSLRPPGPSTPAAVSSLENPFEIKPAVVFAALFIALSMATHVVTTTFGQAGLLILALVVGITDIDPFILSLVKGSIMDQGTLVSAIVLAMLSNTLAKGVYFSVLVRPALRHTGWRFGLWALLHLPLLFLG